MSKRDLLAGSPIASARAPRAALGALALAVLAACSSTSDSAAPNFGSLYDLQSTSNPSADTIEGLWETVQTQTSGGITVQSHSRVLIKNAEVQMANRCSSDGYETVTVGIAVAAQIEPGKATVNDKGGSDEKTTTAPGKPPIVCKATLQGPGVLPYTVGSGKLAFGALNYDKIAD